MRHLHDELLAGIALDEPDRLGLSQHAHLRLCRHCGARLAELRTLVATGRLGEPGPLRAPRPGLLTAIQAELAADAEPVSGIGAPTEPASDVLADRRSSARPPRRHASRLIAAAAVLVVAAGGTFWYRSTTADVVVSQATLLPLPDKSGQGTARLTSRDGTRQLSIDVTAPSAADVFEELWLINTDGKRMISLGVVPADGRATYPVPATSGDLAGYSIVDISLEPYDGNAEHSHNSLLRGTLG